jgi:hypothetical protein
MGTPFPATVGVGTGAPANGKNGDCERGVECSDDITSRSKGLLLFPTFDPPTGLAGSGETGNV